MIFHYNKKKNNVVMFDLIGSVVPAMLQLRCNLRAIDKCFWGCYAFQQAKQ